MWFEYITIDGKKRKLKDWVTLTLFFSTGIAAVALIYVATRFLFFFA